MICYGCYKQGISADFFFAGVCFGCLFTLPIQVNRPLVVKLARTCLLFVLWQNKWCFAAVSSWVCPPRAACGRPRQCRSCCGTSQHLSRSFPTPFSLLRFLIRSCLFLFCSASRVSGPCSRMQPRHARHCSSTSADMNPTTEPVLSKKKKNLNIVYLQTSTCMNHF